ncbi:MAG: threonine--tRNA ligase [Spirochaetes bacterium GWD1_61_31]|nr:MAG: threonine--tRNA ligase [Spirochaetes bacterium GWB1_60_80]OHD30171.1 MAG: threonine--tRNA ligase [Spirochaetes bacterium GWC1_61_12]OHD39894.1 MAG: threonine--tRNA ligase [Spirochaetes bacterium GWD1_61_31]OHD46389.1 MAG: threonine--tRNA ligase [Spirochaetes bacterium GWE1_60_18]OHD59445.1 MAG: threonine--tRNA ligase [Spirochaetes bacterium GWF1_60_12]HAP43565.1 threonine--tRNA ligase [Spirochaetaceae bacterium]
MSHPLETIRHSLSHVMAEAVCKLYPGTKVAIGPAIDDGFYYDFQLPVTVQPEDLPAIEKEMRRIIAANLKFERREISKAEAVALFAAQPFKLELIEGLEDGAITVYSQGEFTDLCRGPHVDTTRDLRPDCFKLRAIAGAYWRGDEKRPMLTRLYAYAFNSKDELNAHLKMLEEAEKRDNRRLGKELGLFSTHEEAGPGLIYWHPKGGRFRVELENWWRDEHYKNGYDLLFTPHIGKAWLWEKSGHLGFYKEGMYAPMEIDEEKYYVKPMNCPFHIMIYNNDGHSYRDLPLRWGELGTVYRYERAGALHGLMRVRGFTQDDAHIICTPEQIEDEIAEVLRFSLSMWKILGFKDIKAYLATRPAGDGAVGAPEMWATALESLRKAVDKEGLPYEMDEGGGAFYGPKIDLKVKDAIGREWQMTTIQFDFNEPERFDMTYVNSDGTKKRPYMVHRALLGSIERFFGVYIEHTAGAFPLWLAPEQVAVIPVGNDFADYAKTVGDQLRRAGLRVRMMLSDDRMNAKIRLAQAQKVPYMLVVGAKERDESTVSPRLRDGRQLESQAVETFIAHAKARVAEKSLEL